MRIFFVLILFLITAATNSDNVVENKSVIELNVDIYSELTLADKGLSKDIFNLAIKGLSKLKLDGAIKNPDIVTIADYSQSSNKKRLYVIDLKNKKLLYNSYVAHGRNSGDEYAKSFSNVEGSYKSSLGFYVTEKPIIGQKTGYSLILHGVEKGFNDNALKREIIVHGADYASPDFIRKHGRLGRSYGCPTLPPDVNKAIIETIRGGTCFFAYNTDSKYLVKSELLN